MHFHQVLLYTYGGQTRKISLSWTVAALSKEELLPMYKSPRSSGQLFQCHVKQCACSCCSLIQQILHHSVKLRTPAQNLCKPSIQHNPCNIMRHAVFHDYIVYHIVKPLLGSHLKCPVLSLW